MDKYCSHDDIDTLMKEYLKTVIGLGDIKELETIPLKDINEFVRGLEDD